MILPRDQSVRLRTSVDEAGNLRVNLPGLRGREVDVVVRPAVGDLVDEEAARRRRLRELWGAIDDPTFVEPYDPPPEDEGSGL